MKRWAIAVQTLGVLVISAIGVSGSGAAEPYKLKLPLGLQEQAAYIPADNPLTAEKIELEKQLYFELGRWRCSSPTRRDEVRGQGGIGPEVEMDVAQ